jgi:iron(III) transport system permease protein
MVGAAELRAGRVDMIRSRAPQAVLVTVLALTALLILVPLGFLLYASLLSAAPGARGAHFSTESWARLFEAHGREAIRNTLVLAFWVTVVSLTLGALLAWLVSRTDTPMRRTLGTLLVLPMLLSPLLTALAWTVLASPRAGLINVAFHHFVPGKTPLFTIFSLGGMVLVMSLYFTPFAYLVMGSAMQGVDTALEDASRVAGAGILTTLRRITLPVVTPALLSAGLLIFALACEQLAVPTLLGLQAKFPTLQYEIYLSMVDSPSNPNYAAAAGCFLLVITVAGLLLYGRMVGVARRFVTVTGKATAARPIQLGPWRWGALGLGVFYLLAAVVLPYAALILGSLLKYVTPELTRELFTLDNYRRLLDTPSVLAALRNTIIFSVGAATITVAFSALLSYLTVRNPHPLSRALEFFALLPLTVPAISLGLGILWAYLFIPIGVYGTAWILILAYLTRFSPQGLRSVSATLVQVDPELELAARVSGASALRALRQITAPLVRQALLAAWILLFVQITTEISMTIMLYTSKTSTAALSVWFAYFGGNSVVAYCLAVILATLSFAVILIGQRFFGLLRHVA